MGWRWQPHHRRDRVLYERFCSLSLTQQFKTFLIVAWRATAEPMRFVRSPVQAPSAPGGLKASPKIIRPDRSHLLMIAVGRAVGRGTLMMPQDRCSAIDNQGPVR